MKQRGEGQFFRLQEALWKIIRDFPGTKAAKEAAKLVEEMSK
jgi:hypothetical protein